LAREIRQAVEELHPAVSELVDRDKLLRLADQAADAAGHARSDPNFGFSVGRSLKSNQPAQRVAVADAIETSLFFGPCNLQLMAEAINLQEGNK